MASPLELLGLQNGLGPAVTGLQQMQENEDKNQMSLADLYLRQQQGQNAGIAGQQAQFDLDQARQMGPSAVQAGVAGNEAKVGEANLAKQQQLGQMINQVGSVMDQVPAQQRMQMLQQLASKVPGITNDPTFQMLSAASPDQLPNMLRQVGTKMMLETGDQLRKQTLQKQGEDARMTQARMEQGAATGRAAMGDNAAMQRQQALINANAALEDKRIEAGKYASKKASNDPATVASKMGFEKASVYYNELARTASDPQEKAEYSALSDQMRQMNIDQKIAAVKPGTTLDQTGAIVPQMPLGAQGGSINTPQGGGDLAGQAAKAFGGYDPQKYDYRINPETGRIQRKAK